MNPYPWQNEILTEKRSTILECLEDEKLFWVDRTALGFQIVEMCDGYYGTTLSVDQMRRLIAELQQLVDEANQ